MVPQTAHNVYVCVGWGGGGGIMCVCGGGAGAEDLPYS